MIKKVTTYKKTPRCFEKQSIDDMIVTKRIEGNIHTAINQLIIYFLTADDHINPLPMSSTRAALEVYKQEKVERVYAQVINIIKFTTTEYERIRNEERIKRNIKTKIDKGYNPISSVEGIIIYQSELDFLQTVDDVDTQKLLFTILCYLKFIQTKYQNDNLWCNFENRLYFKSANLRLSTKEQNLMIKNLANLGYIRLSYQIDKLTFYASFAEKLEHKGQEAVITDFENLGMQYLQLIGEDIIQCVYCGRYIKNPHHKQWGLCQSCKRLEKFKPYADLKLVKCEECGKNFLVNKKNNKSHYCENCQKERDRMNHNQRQNKYQNRIKSTNDANKI